MKAENTTKIQFDSLSINEAYARSVVAAFLARYDPTVPQLADLKTAVSEAVTNCIVHAYPDRIGPVTLCVAVYPEREVLFPFREETKSMTPEAFIQEILVERMDAKLICVGEDFRFGCGRRGNVEMLDEYASKYGYELCVFPKICEDGEVISSTRIRRELAEGKIETANRLLGDPYFVSGEVVHGNALGRTIGMPTANLVPGSQKLLPVYGVYASRVEVDGKIYAGVTNVGVKPTVGASQANVETTLLHFDGDLYGKQMKVYFLYFLRPEQRFESLDALKAQMAYDKKRAEELL